MHTYINNNACIIQPLLRLTPPRFQVLFHSFFKVLFIFPSRYLFAIGLLNIFSLWWSLPPTSSCNPKQLDSTKHCFRDVIDYANTGFSPSMTWLSNPILIIYYTKQYFYTPQLNSFKKELIRIGLFPLHSPLLRESSLFSFPLLS